MSETVAEKLPRFLTAKQAARLLNLSISHVYRAVGRGEIPVKRIGRAVRIPRSFIEQVDAI